MLSSYPVSAVSYPVSAVTYPSQDGLTCMMPSINVHVCVKERILSPLSRRTGTLAGLASTWRQKASADSSMMSRSSWRRAGQSTVRPNCTRGKAALCRGLARWCVHLAPEGIGRLKHDVAQLLANPLSA